MRHPLVLVALASAALVSLGVGYDALAAGTVGTGSPASCDETSFNTALAGGGVVTFDCGGAATITFTTTKSITAATTLTGSPGIVLDGGGAVRLFTVTGGGLTVTGLTLSGGQDSAALAGGAAITASAPVSITDSTISGHNVTNGGCPAIVISGTTLTMLRSTVSGNTNNAAATGHPICGNNTAALTITNSTISGNTGGALSTSGTASITNSTIAGNTSTGLGNTGGLISFDGVITLVNTIVANNAGTGQCAIVPDGVIIDGGNNLQFPDGACGATIPVADPQLGPLADYGGPTRTMAIAQGSPAVDAGDDADCPATDQRGVARADGDGDGLVTCDIGAYEAPLFVPPSVPVPLAPALPALIALLLGAWAASRARR